MTTTTRVYSVPGISCEHCVSAITKHVEPVPGVTALEVDLETRTVTVTGGEEADIVAAIDEAGYDVEPS